jgi:hypothetical protein
VISDPSKERLELERIRKVSDMLCSGHSHLRDGFARKALLSEIVVLGCSTWLLALTFVDDATAVALAPFEVSPKIWLGVLGAATFFVTLVRMKADWKGRADAHGRTCEMYAEVHRECGYLLAKGDHIDLSECQRVIARYDMATDVGTGLPEREFLAAKRRHKMKIAISKHLDLYPGTPVVLARLMVMLTGLRSLRHITHDSQK